MASGGSRRSAALLAMLLVGQMVLMSGSARGRPEAARVERFVLQLSSPVVNAGGALGGVIAGTLGTLGELWLAHERALVLEDRVRELTAELQRHREVEAENDRLRRLLAMRELEVPRSISATVVTSQQEGSTQTIVIDRGTRDGVFAPLPVVAWGGAVGRVLVAGRTTSKVRLLTDVSSGVGALIQRNRVHGIVEGRAPRLLELHHVPRFAEVYEGDRVVTSGQDEIFPRGFGIGVVTGIREAADGTRTVELTPDLDYSRLEEVLVLLEAPVREPLDEIEAVPDDAS